MQAAKDSDQDDLSSSPDHVLEELYNRITPVASAVAGSSLQALALHNCHGITPAGLQAVAAACPQLQMLFLGGSTLQVPKQQSSVMGPGQIPMLNSIPRSRAATIAGVLQKSPSCFHPAAKPIAAELAALILQLQNLVLLEITFLPHGTRLELRSLIADSCGNRHVQVLDMCESKSITAAVTYSNSNVKHRSRGSDGTLLMRGKMQAYLKLLIEAAVNCSNAARQTPLHVAVDVDEASAVEVSQACPVIACSVHRSPCTAPDCLLQLYFSIALLVPLMSAADVHADQGHAVARASNGMFAIICVYSHACTSLCHNLIVMHPQKTSCYVEAR